MSRTVWIVPIAPLQMRYSNWWNDLFLREIEKEVKRRELDWKVEYIYDPSPYNSLHTKFEATEHFARYITDFEVQSVLPALRAAPIKKEDLLLCLDGCTPGLVAAYLHSFKPCPCVCFCHGSAFNKHDIWAQHTYRKGFDLSALSIFDVVLVASQYHEDKLTDAGLNNLCNMGALPDNPALVTERQDSWFLNDKQDICIVDRPGIQKRNSPLINAIQSRFAVTDIHGIYGTWNDYYKKLSQFKFLLVTAEEETYGYQVQEAMALGVIPLCPNRLCYPEFVHDSFLYVSQGDLIGTLEESGRSNAGQVAGPITPLNYKEKAEFWSTLVTLFVIAF